VLYAAIICPATEIEPAFYANETAFAHIFSGYFSLAPPQLNVKPVCLFLFGGAIYCHAERGLNSARLKVTHFRIFAGASYKHYSIYHGLPPATLKTNL
jgi:hypothetical protein